MMSKSKSPQKRGLRVLYLLPLVCLGLSLQAQTVFVPADKGTEKVRIKQTGGELPLCIIRSASGEEREVSNEELEKIDPQTIESMEVLKDQAAIEKYGDKAKNGVVIVKLREFNATLQYDNLPGETKPAIQVRPVAPNANPDVLFILRQPWGEEKELSAEDVANLETSRIKSMDILKDKATLKKYGEKAKNGVVVVTMKSPTEMDEIVVVSYREPDDEPVAFRVIPDKMPGFQGGDQNEFSRWLCRQIDVPKDCNHSGTMNVSFEVYANGTVGDVKITKGVCPELDALVSETILKSPKWEPGTSKGKPVDTRLTIPVVFQVRRAPRK